jgi:hypothetical protein
VGGLDNPQPNVSHDHYSNPLARPGTEVQPAGDVESAQANLLWALDRGFDAAALGCDLRVTLDDMSEPGPVAQRDATAQGISQFSIDHPAF